VYLYSKLFWISCKSCLHVAYVVYMHFLWNLYHLHAYMAISRKFSLGLFYHVCHVVSDKHMCMCLFPYCSVVVTPISCRHYISFCALFRINVSALVILPE
jgi:hypothetical protein